MGREQKIVRKKKVWKLKVNSFFKNFWENGKVRNGTVVGNDRRIERRFFQYWSNDRWFKGGGKYISSLRKVYKIENDGIEKRGKIIKNFWKNKVERAGRWRYRFDDGDEVCEGDGWKVRESEAGEDAGGVWDDEWLVLMERIWLWK